MILLALIPAVLPAVAGEYGAAVLGFGIIGFVLAVAGAVAGRLALIASSALAFLVETVFAIESGSASAWWMVGYAAALFFFLDVGSGVVERHHRLPGAYGNQVSRALLLTLGAAVVSAMVLLLARLPIEHGILVQAAGLGAAATLILAVAGLTRTGERDER